MFEYVINPAASTLAGTEEDFTIVSVGALKDILQQPTSDEDLEEQEWDAIVSQPHVQRGLSRMVANIRRQIVAGEIEEGGFAVE